MPVDYIPYYPQPIGGQAVLDNFTRTRRLLAYRDNDKVMRHISFSQMELEDSCPQITQINAD